MNSYREKPYRASYFVIGLGVDVVEQWLRTDIVGCLQTFFIDCQKGDFLNDPEVCNMFTQCTSQLSKQAQLPRCLIYYLQIKNIWEILSGQHRTNAGDEFVNGVKAVETEWVAQLGRTLCPIFYRKMPQRVARRLSAGFQDKESKPQV